MGFTIAYLLLPFVIIKIILNKNINYCSFLIWIPLYALLSFIQIIFISDIDLNVFGIKLLTIFSFIAFFYFSQKFYCKYYDKYIIISLILTSIYAVYAAFSYLLVYNNYLIPGTCGISNINQYGILRCSTFGEGNYFGNYLALVSILYADRSRILCVTFLISLIAFSPIPIVLILYLLVRNHIKNQYFIFIIILIYLIYYVSNTEQILAAIYSETSSFGERCEFIRSAIAMAMDHLLLGVGLGQYGFNLPYYTNFQHLIQMQLSGVRFIPNNNFSELFSEQGIFGILFFWFYLKSFRYGFIGNLSHIPITILIILIGSAMPTLYLVYVSVLTGCISCKMKINYLNSRLRLSN